MKNKTLTPEDKRQLIQLKKEKIKRLETIKCDWSRIARENQLLPQVDFSYWLILAGRGFGKTRTGAETVRQWIKTNRYVNFVGATSDDAREIMIDGESGIMAICPRHERPRYLSHKRKLIWPNGASSLVFTADEPERLRGKQHNKLWCDELASWRYAEAWDQAVFGLRLGLSPQAIITTTPKPTKIIKEIAADPDTIVTTGTTYDNQKNLAKKFFTSIIKKYEGTRLGRQELNAEILDDNPNALWKRINIDLNRVRVAPDLVRIVVGVDPAVTSNENSDLTGIVVAGVDANGHYYVLDDNSLLDTPGNWAKAVVRTYNKNMADRVIGESNNGGDLIELALRSVDDDAEGLRGADLSYKKIHASKGKYTRAEPVAALYEQDRVHHVGFFAKLEDEMCDYDPITSKLSPNRMDALVWAITELMSEGGTGGLLGYYKTEAKGRGEDEE